MQPPLHDLAGVCLFYIGDVMTDTPQKEDGFTPIANEIMEALMKVNLSAYESRVLWFLFRKTYGWNKKTDWITLSQFSACIGLDRRLIHRAIKSLSSKKMIVIERDDTFKIRYGFQKDFKKWKLSSKKMTVINRDTKLSSKEMTRLSSIQIPTKETITKETIQKKRDIVFPEWLDANTWNEFKKMRVSIKKKMTPYAEELMIKKLDRLRQTGNPPTEVLERSIAGGWQGIFEIGGNNGRNNPRGTNTTIGKAKSDEQPYPVDFEG